MPRATKQKNNKVFFPDFIIKPFPIMQAIREGNLNQLDGDVYGIVYWFHSMKDGVCKASNSRIADILASTPRTVRRCLQRLEENGFVELHYKDPQKKNRLKVTPLVTFINFAQNTPVEGHLAPSRVGPTGPTVGPTDPTQVGPTGPQISNNIISNSYIYTGADGKKVDMVSEAIKAFEEVNPTCKRYYGNKTQRKAIEHLLDDYGLDMVLKVIQILPKTNEIPYLPTITTPYKLEQKWQDLKAGMTKQNNKHKQEDNEIVGFDVINQ